MIQTSHATAIRDGWSCTMICVPAPGNRIRTAMAWSSLLTSGFRAHSATRPDGPKWALCPVLAVVVGALTAVVAGLVGTCAVVVVDGVAPTAVGVAVVGAFAPGSAPPTVVGAAVVRGAVVDGVVVGAVVGGAVLTVVEEVTTGNTELSGIVVVVSTGSGSVTLGVLDEVVVEEEVVMVVVEVVVLVEEVVLAPPRLESSSTPISVGVGPPSALAVVDVVDDDDAIEDDEVFAASTLPPAPAVRPISSLSIREVSPWATPVGEAAMARQATVAVQTAIMAVRVGSLRRLLALVTLSDFSPDPRSRSTLKANRTNRAATRANSTLQVGDSGCATLGNEPYRAQVPRAHHVCKPPRSVTLSAWSNTNRDSPSEERPTPKCSIRPPPFVPPSSTNGFDVALLTPLSAPVVVRRR